MKENRLSKSCSYQTWRVAMIKRATTFMTIAIVFSLLSTGCQENQEDEGKPLQEIAFSIAANLPNAENGRQLAAASISELSQAIFTITKSNGVATDYINASMDIYQFNGRVSSESFSLPAGDYKVTAFALADGNNEILYATPKESSPQAVNVTTPLEIDFQVASGVKNEISIEVVSVSGLTPSDFGLPFSEIGVVETIDFRMSVTALGETDFIPSTLTIAYDEDYTYTQELTGAEDVVQVSAQSESDYTVTVTAAGFAPYEVVLPPAELMSYETEEKPFAVELATANVDLEKFQVKYGTNVTEGSYAIRQTTDGGYIIAAERYNPSSDVLIIKLDATGNLVWEKTYGGSGSDNATSIDQTSDGGYVVCGSTSSADGDVEGKNHQGTDAWAFKLSATGELLWQKTLGGSSEDTFFEIQETTDGGYIMAGYTESSDGDVNTHIEGRDAWVVKLAADQSIEWEQAYGNTHSDEAVSIQQTSDGGYILLERNNGGHDKRVFKLLPNGEGSIQWEISPGSDPSYFSNILQTLDGGFIMSCSDGVRKLNANGIVEWLHATSDHRSSVVQTQDGQYAVLGDDSVRKLNSNGQEVWTRDINEHKGEALLYFLYSMDATADGGVVIAGDIAPESVQNYDVWVLKLDSEGNL